MKNEKDKTRTVNVHFAFCIFHSRRPFRLHVPGSKSPLAPPPSSLLPGYYFPACPPSDTRKRQFESANATRVSERGNWNDAISGGSMLSRHCKPSFTRPQTLFRFSAKPSGPSRPGRRLRARAEITWPLFVERISNPSLFVERISNPFQILQLKTLFLRRPYADWLAVGAAATRAPPRGFR